MTTPWAAGCARRREPSGVARGVRAEVAMSRVEDWSFWWLTCGHHALGSASAQPRQSFLYCQVCKGQAMVISLAGRLTSFRPGSRSAG